MKNACLTLLLILPFFTVFSQINKAYFNENGKLVNDAKKANYYILIEKLSDSAFLVKKFDMSDRLQVRGTYRDEKLTTPAGKFAYYGSYLTYSTVNNIIQADTNIYLKSSGYFLNGQKAGTWAEFNVNGTKQNLCIYDSGSLNGLFQQFDEAGTVVQSGNYIKGKKEGEWQSFEPGIEQPALVEIYANGKLKNKQVHLTGAIPADGFKNYVKNATKSFKDSLNFAVISLLLTEEGKIDSVTTNIKLSSKTASLVNDIFLKSPQFKPSLYDSKPIKIKYVFDYNGTVNDNNSPTQNTLRYEIIAVPVSSNGFSSGVAPRASIRNAKRIPIN